MCGVLGGMGARRGGMVKESIQGGPKNKPAYMGLLDIGLYKFLLNVNFIGGRDLQEKAFEIFFQYISLVFFDWLKVCPHMSNGDTCIPKRVGAAQKIDRIICMRKKGNTY